MSCSYAKSKPAKPSATSGFVTSGLQAGDRVIVSGLQRIRPGIKARAISSSQENASTESKQ